MSSDLVADSSFYICFLSDIDCPNHFMRILDRFKAHLSPRLLEEIIKTKNIDTILKKKGDRINIFEKSPFEIGEVLRPLLSRKEIAKGEYEIVVLAYFCHNLKFDFVLIIDEKSPRNFLIRNFPYLGKYLVGTVDFIGDCCLIYKIFKKDESLELLGKIEKSKFRVSPQILLNVKNKIEAS